MDAVADEIHIPDDDVGCIQARSQPRIDLAKRRLMPAPLGKDRCERERSQGSPEYGDVGSEHTVSDRPGRVAVPAEFVDRRPHDGCGNTSLALPD
jgi:hypothetical protein